MNDVSTSTGIGYGVRYWNTNYNDAKYVGYMYGGMNEEESSSRANAVSNETDSNVKTRLDTWYKTNIIEVGGPATGPGYGGDMQVYID